MKIDLNIMMGHIKNTISFLALFGVTVELIPIKISPLQWLGKRMNKATNDRIDKIQKQVDDIEYRNAMKDLADVRNRLISYGLLMQKGEKFDFSTLSNIQHDLDIYDFYKEKYVYMELNGRKIKINGEIETTRKLVDKQINNLDKSK